MIFEWRDEDKIKDGLAKTFYGAIGAVKGEKNEEAI